MDVTINNIAKIRSAKLVCQGLTAIIGDNDKGKSTVGKVLYSIFHTFASLKDGFFDARAGYVLDSLKLRNTNLTRRLFRADWFSSDAPIADEDLEQRLQFHLRHGLSRQGFSTVVSSRLHRESAQELMEDIKLQIKKARGISEMVLFRDAVQSDLNRYFNNQFIPNYFDVKGESEISITIKGRKIVAKWNANEQPMVVEEFLHNDAWFIGTPLIMDALGATPRMTSWTIGDSINRELASRIRRARPRSSIARRVADEELSTVYGMIDSYLSGDFSIGKDGELEVGISGMNKPLNVANLSMGIKMLALLRLMVDVNLLKRKDVLILDEPENHLHPELQVLFADVIVELQRVYDLTVLVTTHSPYFLQSLELSARKKRAEDGEGETLRVYQPKTVDDLGRVEFDDVSNDTSSMYRKFARTMRELELERMKVAELEKSVANNGVQD